MSKYTPCQAFPVWRIAPCGTLRHAWAVLLVISLASWVWSEEIIPEITRIIATVDETPIRTVRSPYTNQWFEKSFYRSSLTAASWNTGDCIVLVENSLSGIPLEVTGRLWQGGVRWKVVRNPDDAAALQAAPFPNGDISVNPIVGSGTRLSLDHVGSFSVVAYFDYNSNNDYDPGETCKFLNVVVCRVTLQVDRSQAHASKQRLDFGTLDSWKKDHVLQAEAPVAFQVRWGEFHFQGDQPDPALAGVEFEAVVDVVGGGPDGRLGVDRVHTGWSQNLWISSPPTTTYQQGHSVVRYIPNVPASILTPDFITGTVPGVGLPAPMSPALDTDHPLLDAAARSRGPGPWGARVCLSTTDDTSVARVNLALGQRRTTKAVDAPSSIALRAHPRSGTVVEQIDANIDFATRLVVWTSSAPRVSAGMSTYSCILEIPWWCRGTYDNFNFEDIPVSFAVVAHDIACGDKAVHSPSVPLSSLAAEVTAPTASQRWGCFDATH
jgi:hypothetical protein